MKFYLHKHFLGLFLPLTKYKGVECNLHYPKPHLYFCVSLAIMTKGDHSPGFMFDVRLFGLGFEIDFYDFRHKEDK